MPEAVDANGSNQKRSDEETVSKILDIIGTELGDSQMAGLTMEDVLKNLGPGPAILPSKWSHNLAVRIPSH